MFLGVRLIVICAMLAWLLYMTILGWGPGGAFDTVARLNFAIAVALSVVARSSRTPRLAIDRQKLAAHELRQLKLVDAGSVLMVALLVGVFALDLVGDLIMGAGQGGRELVRIGAGLLVGCLCLAIPTNAAYGRLLRKVGA